MIDVQLTIAAPFCCDLDYFMNAERWERAAVLFVLAPLLIAFWRPRDEARVLGGFVGTLIVLYLSGEVAQRLELYRYLKILPCQLGGSLPALFFFLLLPAGVKDALTGGRTRRLVGGVAFAGAAWLLYDRSALGMMIEPRGRSSTSSAGPIGAARLPRKSTGTSACIPGFERTRRKRVCSSLR